MGSIQSGFNQTLGSAAASLGGTRLVKGAGELSEGVKSVAEGQKAQESAQKGISEQLKRLTYKDAEERAIASLENRRGEIMTYADFKVDPSWFDRQPEGLRENLRRKYDTFSDVKEAASKMAPDTKVMSALSQLTGIFGIDEAGVSIKEATAEDAKEDKE